MSAKLIVDQVVPVHIEGPEMRAPSLKGSMYDYGERLDRLDRDSEIIVGLVQIDKRLNDVDAFTEHEQKTAGSCNALALCILGDFHDPKAKRVSLCEDSHSDDFRELNPIIKFFIEGVEAQLRRRVLFLAYSVKGAIQWRPVPRERENRWHIEGQEEKSR